MSGGKKSIEQIEITLLDRATSHQHNIYIDIYENSLSRKWLTALNELITNQNHLEKNFCFLGFVESQRNAEYIIDQINRSISAINKSNLGYTITDCFTVENTILPGPVTNIDGEGGSLVHEKLNLLHHHFENLQGVSGNMSEFYTSASAETRWHIRQLNLLCHEYESLVLSLRKALTAPEWCRPSQLMCWLNSPRFLLDEQDYELFGIESISRPLGGVFVGVNKSIGKHHWEVFVDEAEYNPTHKADNLTTSVMRAQCEASGDFDIEWANNPGNYEWQKRHLQNFRIWLINNGFDPDDKSLTIGHPQVGQVDLEKSFNTTDYQKIWKCLGSHLDVCKISTSDASTIYTYHWSDSDYQQQQTRILK